MSRPDPIEYAETLYDAIAAANFSPIAFLSFGNAVKDGVPFRNMPRLAAEPFMRVVGEMLDLEEETSSADNEVPDAEVLEESVDAPQAAASERSERVSTTSAEATSGNPSQTTQPASDSRAAHGRRKSRS
jgi:hypothetical protein